MRYAVDFLFLFVSLAVQQFPADQPKQLAEMGWSYDVYYVIPQPLADLLARYNPHFLLFLGLSGRQQQYLASPFQSAAAQQSACSTR